MNTFKNIYRRLDRVQSSRWFHIAASVVVLAACAGFFGYLVVKSHALDSQKRMLIEALSGQNINNNDEHAASLRASGTVFVNGRRYGGQSVLESPAPRFDEQGFILAPPALADELLLDQRPLWAPQWLLDQPGTTWMLALVTTAWLLAIVWIDLSLPFVLTLLGTAIPVLLLRLFNAEGAMLAVAGMGLLTFTFVLISRLLLLALNRPWQAFAVAHTVVKEAARTRVSLVFIVLLLIALPLIPLWLDSAAPLRFRVQTFIARSMGLTFMIAACMTLFLACATVAFEIRDRQIWQLMTKPMHRFNYLFGKWLGVMAVNLAVLAVSGVSIFTFVQYLRSLPPPRADESGLLDSLAVRDEVLTARSTARPDYQSLSTDEIRKRIEDRMRNDPELAEMGEMPLPLRRRFEEEAQKIFMSAQRTVPPTTDPRNPGRREYRFTGLKSAKNLNSTMTVRYKFHILRDDEHEVYPAAFVFNDDLANPRHVRYVPTMSHNFPIGPDLIQDDGSLKVTIVNLFRPREDQQGLGALNFDEADFEILYKVSNFEGNFFRAVLVSWVKLAFLAAMGVAASTFLSFPVACLLGFTVFAAGTLGPYLAEALEWFYPPETKDMDWGNIAMVLYWALHWVTRIIALAVTWLLSGFGEYRPTADLVEGRLIPWSRVLVGIVRLGIIWTGLSMLVGWLVLRRRQLAIYSGHG